MIELVKSGSFCPLFTMFEQIFRPLFTMFGQTAILQIQQQTTMDRINEEQEDLEAMVAEAAKMMLDIDRHHLEEFISKSSVTRTYEEWIADLHPENVVTVHHNANATTNANVTTSATSIGIDHRLYVEDSDHRMLWNELIGDSERMFVPSRSSSLLSSSSSSLQLILKPLPREYEMIRGTFLHTRGIHRDDPQYISAYCTISTYVDSKSKKYCTSYIHTLVRHNRATPYRYRARRFTVRTRRMLLSF